MSAHIHTIYRAMKVADDGLPTLGQVRDTLGARPGHALVEENNVTDIPVDENGDVEPSSGGMSVTIRDVKQMPRFLRPRELGGTGRHPVFEMDLDNLGNNLRLQPDSPYHALVEPTHRCPFSEYLAALHATRFHWRRI